MECFSVATAAQRASHKKNWPRAGVSVNAIGAMERGLTHTPHQDTLELLAAALALTPAKRAELEACAGSFHHLAQK